MHIRWALGIVTALGGGTIRDLIIAAKPFWIVDSSYLWAAAAGALVAFFLGELIRSTQRAVLYADGLGAALFVVAAVNKILSMQFPESAAVMMGVLTGIGGGWNHPYRDGNKRIGVLAMVTFLGLNGDDVHATDAEIVAEFLALADGRVSEEALADWIRQQSSKRRRFKRT